MKTGKFITFEGIDGAGKSTHLAWLESFLRGKGIEVVVTREPGGTPLGENIRALLLDGRESMHPETEALLMFASRREHVERVILAPQNRQDRHTRPEDAPHLNSRATVSICTLVPVKQVN